MQRWALDSQAEASQQWGFASTTLKHLFTTSPQQRYAPSVWALESHWRQKRPDETSVITFANTLFLCFYSLRNNKKKACQKYLFSSKSIHLSELLFVSHFCFLFAFVHVCVFPPLGCKHSAGRRQQQPPVRWGQPMESATGKETGPQVNLHDITPMLIWWWWWWFFIFVSNISFFSLSFPFSSSPVAVFTKVNEKKKTTSRLSQQNNQQFKCGVFICRKTQENFRRGQRGAEQIPVFGVVKANRMNHTTACWLSRSNVLRRQPV